MAAEGCNTVLSLGLGVHDYAAAASAAAAAARHKRSRDDNNKRAAAARANCIDLSFTLCPKDDEDAGDLDHHKFIGDGKFVHKSYELNIGSRKKLRLTKEQSSLLEDIFNLHDSLNSSQKQALAEQMDLKPRQVEVWFQNRRARSKLKQTEVDYEFMKKCHESLSNENKRLKKELQSIKAEASPLFQKATTCPSCNKIK